VKSTPLLIENTYMFKLAKNHKFHSQTKHINMKYNLNRYNVEENTIHL